MLTWCIILTMLARMTVSTGRQLETAPAEDGIEGIKITLNDGAFPLCKFSYYQDGLNKFCAFYGGLPYERLAKGPAYQAVVTVENTDKENP